MFTFYNYINRHLQNRNFILLLLADISSVVMSFYFSLVLRFDFNIPEEFHGFIKSYYFLIFLLYKLILFKLFNLYKGMWRYTSLWDIINILKANILINFSSFFIFSVVLKFTELPISIFILDTILCSFLIGLSRIIIRLFLQKNTSTIINKDLPIKKIIIVGAGFTGKQILSQIIDESKNNFKAVGILDDNLDKIGGQLLGVKVIGTVDYLKSIKFEYDSIYICCPSATSLEMKRIINICSSTGKNFKTLPSLSELIEEDVNISQLREVSLNDLLGREEIVLNKKSIKSMMKGKKVLITGAGGSIGSELVRQCVKYSPGLLILLDSSEFNLFEIEQEINMLSNNITVKPILADIREFDIMNRIFEEFKPELVYHAAAYKHVPIQESFPQEAIKTNIIGSLNLMKLSIKFKIERFVLVSTDKAVRPKNIMGATKRIVENLVQYSNLSSTTKFMSVRFGNVLGSSGSVIPTFQKQIKNGGPVTITDINMERYFMSIPEASQLILQAGSIGHGGEIFILDMGEPIKIIDIAKQLIKLSGLKIGDDIEISVTGRRPGEKDKEELAYDKNKLDNTKHEKIYVLENDFSKNDEQKFIYQEADKLNIPSINKLSKKQLKLELESILPEYKS